MKNNIFREYDIRGIVGEEFTIEDSTNIAKGIVSYFLQENPNTQRIAIGMDGRVHSPQIKEKVIEAISDMGIDIIDIGLCPTPVFYFSLFNNPRVQSGFIITASHNPKEYNGFKICLDKRSVWGENIQKIKEIINTNNFAKNVLNKKGTIEHWDATDAYINWLEDHFAHLKNLKISALIDSGNGAGGAVIPKLVERMNWKNVKLIFQEIDGNFPNHEADPTSPKNMQEAIKQLKNSSDLEIGIGLDGDCDRMSPITKDGEVVAGDKLLSIYAKQVLDDQPGAPIVFDIKSSQGLIDQLKNFGANPIIAPSGHSLIKNAMLKNNALLAGELSCHFFFKHRYFGYDDGIYAMMRLFEILQESNQSLESLLRNFPLKNSSPEYRIKCNENDKNKIIEKVKDYFKVNTNAKLITIDGVRTKLEYGWGLARMSNTQPVISLRFESDSNDGLKKIKNEFANALLPYYEGSFLKKELGL